MPGCTAPPTPSSAWPYYGDLVGARFASHPPLGFGAALVVDRGHPSTATLPNPWPRLDEWYEFAPVPGPASQILLRTAPSHVDSGAAGRPLAWYHQVAGVRCFYTALGHTTESYTDPTFLSHLCGGVSSVLRAG